MCIRDRYNTVSADLSDLSDVYYDVLAFFSPRGIESLFENFPEFQQNKTRIAVFGNTTLKVAEEKGLFVNIKAPSPEAPSMTKALENYICLLYTSPSPRDRTRSRMPSSA